MAKLRGFCNAPRLEMTVLIVRNEKGLCKTQEVLPRKNAFVLGLAKVQNPLHVEQRLANVHLEDLALDFDGADENPDLVAGELLGVRVR